VALPVVLPTCGAAYLWCCLPVVLPVVLPVALPVAPPAALLLPMVLPVALLLPMVLPVMQPRCDLPLTIPKLSTVET
jgi:hypothetical protein